MEEYEGIISKVIFYNPENQYIVALLRQMMKKSLL